MINASDRHAVFSAARRQQELGTRYRKTIVLGNEGDLIGRDAGSHLRLEPWISTQELKKPRKLLNRIIGHNNESKARTNGLDRKNPKQS